MVPRFNSRTTDAISAHSVSALRGDGRLDHTRERSRANTPDGEETRNQAVGRVWCLRCSQHFAHHHTMGPGVKSFLTGIAHSGAGKVLRDNAQQLGGGAVAPKLPAHTNDLVFFLQQSQGNAFVSYCSSKQPDAKLVPGLMKVVIRADPSVPVNYAMSALLCPEQPGRQIDAWRFHNFLMTTDAQARLLRYGFIPVTDNASATPKRTNRDKGRYRSSSLVHAQRLSDLSQPSHRTHPVQPDSPRVPGSIPASLSSLSADGRRATPCRHVHRARAAPVAQTHDVVLLAARGTGWGESRRPHSGSR